jgi:NAD(P)-dependent dehydrogenase (short-subunit alcohol dehydrogenase family)
MIRLMKLFSLKGRVAVITGGGKGLGKIETLALAEAGANTVVVDVNFPDARQTAKEAESLGSKSIAIKADVTNQSSLIRAVEKTLAKFGKIDILVNNAGINIRKPVLDFTAKDWQRILNTNLVSYYLLSKAVCEHMIARRSGNIINIASNTARVVIFGRTAYAASKAAVVQLTRHFAIELAAHGIRCNAICPGPMATDFNLKMKEKNVPGIKQFVEQIPMKRIGEPFEIGGAVVYLASDASSYMTGSIIYLDGGWSAQA